MTVPESADSVKLWRVSNYQTLEGLGGLNFSGRWHTAGRPIVYLADSPAGALFETLVHLEVNVEDMPPAYTLLAVEVSSAVKIATVQMSEENWKDDLDVTRALGDAWLASRKEALLSVPSVLVPRSSNYLLNPLHPEASRIVIKERIDGRYDPRLFRVSFGR